MGVIYMTKSDKPRRLHPKVREAKDLMDRGRMDRREFVRVAALLGVSATAAYAMGGVTPSFAQQGDLELFHDRRCNVVLDGEDVVQFTVVGF